MQESKAIKDYRQKLLADIETKRKPLREKEESTKALQEELKKEGPKMSASRRRSQEEKLAAELKELRRLKEDIDTEIAKMERELTQQALRDIEKVIKKIAKKEDYAIVFEKNAAGIVYFKDSVDITESIIADYDKR
jgi:outer membrane protein